jgi:hypothetical protein
MKHTARILAILSALLPALAAAQVPSFPQTLPANTVIGRLGTGPGPSQAITFAQLLARLGITLPISVASGGTGSTTAKAARTALNIEGLAIPGDTNYTILPTDRAVAHLTLTGARTDTLPACSALNPNQLLVISDIYGQASAIKTVTIQRSGLDTINGNTSFTAISAAYGAAIMWCDGVSRWTFFTASGGGGGGGVTDIAAGAGIKTGTGSDITSTGTLLIDPTYLAGLLGGLTMSNDGTLPNTVIDTAAGIAVSDDNTALMKIAAFNKNANATWAVGSSNGCADGAASYTTLGASTWYHLYVIQRTDTNVVDLLCSKSSTSPALPTSYTVKRRIGSFKTDGSSHILAFSQNGNEFLWAATPLDVNGATLGTTAASYPLSVPSGLKVNALTHVNFANAAAAVGLLLYSPDETTPAGFVLVTNSANNIGGQFNVRTDTSAQVTAKSTAAASTISIWTDGWIDTRGAASVAGPAVGAILTTPPTDATSLLQSLLTAGSPIVIPCNGTIWNVTGLTIPAGGASIRGDCPSATIHLTANATAIDCSSVSNQVSVRSLTITGTAANYAGNISDISDLSQRGVHISNCSQVEISGVNFKNLSGAGLDCEGPGSGFTLPWQGTFANLTATSTYRGFYTHNSCEYVNFTNIVARNNIFGMNVLSGNVTVSGFEFVYNYNNLQVVGQSNNNPCHDTFSGGKSNHSNFNLEVLSCSVGLSVTGVDFVGDPSGSLTTSGAIHIQNSRGVNISGGQMGSNIAVQQCDSVTLNCTLAGANMLNGTYVRNDISGFTNPTVNYAGGLLIKNNYVSTGMWGQNN